MGFILAMQVGSILKNQCNSWVEDIKKEKHLIISTDAVKAFDKIQHLFMIKNSIN